MMTVDGLLKPLLAGFSVGAFCMSYCFPFLVPFIASEHRAPRRNLALISYFLLGRFLGYLVFGFIFGYLGEKLQSPYLTLITDLSLILISIVMILHITGVLKQKSGICLAPHVHNRHALVMGFLLGVNICPPFMLSLAYVTSLHSIVQSVVYFVIFFCASSVYFLPVVFAGMLAKIKNLQNAARFSGILAACVFLIYGFYSITQNFILELWR